MRINIIITICGGVTLSLIVFCPNLYTSRFFHLTPFSLCSRTLEILSIRSFSTQRYGGNFIIIGGLAYLTTIILGYNRI